MVKHIVLWQLNADMDATQRMQVMNEFRTAILALRERIPFIQSVEVEFNINPKEQYDLALYSEFASLDDVRAYAVHPDHVAAAQIIRPHVKTRACVDYEI